MNLIAVTNRKLCRDSSDFMERLRILAEHLREDDAVLLREKDLDRTEYLKLAESCSRILKKSPARFILHTYADFKLSRELHLPIPFLETASLDLPAGARISTSVHSTQQLKQALRYHPEFLIAGHIYPTACKEGLTPRGLGFLSDICRLSDVPVYAIGGIDPERIPEIKKAGAAGICIMSRLMTTPDLSSELSRIFSADP